MRTMSEIHIQGDSSFLLQFLKTVVLNPNDAVLITKAESPVPLGPTIIYVNDAFTRMTGYSYHDVVGKSPRLLQGPLSGTEGPARIREALKRWDPIEIQLMNYRKDGSTFWVELSITPVCDEAGWYTHWISVQRDVTERRATEEALAQLRLATVQNDALKIEIEQRAFIEARLNYVAVHDSLTGLWNRNEFMDHLRSTLLKVQAGQGYRAVVLYLDLDGFKGINDTLGHRVGDLLLTEVALRLKSCARSQDTLARMSGDEFTFILDDVKSREQAQRVASRMLAAINAPLLLGGTVLQLTGSVGLCEVFEAKEDAEDILRNADLAMFEAKRQGGGLSLFYDETMHLQAMELLQTKLSLKTALGRGELELFYQPFVSLHSTIVDGMEALLRWNHPSRGLLGPTAFIPLAEETGDIVGIGSWILRQAFRDFKSMQASCSQRLCLSVNVSSRQLDEPMFVDDLVHALEETRMEHGLLQLEITESIFLKDATRIGHIFRSIRDLGVKIAFDDFGTGYSSLSYLEKYPIDTLKIDQSFVRNMARGTMNAEIVSMIVKLARAGGMSVSAEGVETEEQADGLRKLGVTRAQGYLYSSPVPFAAMNRILLRGLIPIWEVPGKRRIGGIKEPDPAAPETHRLLRS